MLSPRPDGIPALLRTPLVLGGLLLVLVGTAELIVGHRKTLEYQERQAQLAPLPLRSPTTLYPKVGALAEKHALVAAKIGYYELLTGAGRVLALLGLVAVCVGALYGRSVKVARSR
jgi:hypothetical protein